ncbi:tyrosine-type recombinase/integrase [Anaerosacchariphilus polymeriproducens]|uniref:tyrosine-type recombinase/integrase n=1 Tax=Anaerosacchariphilus polymeriproducens TaxID=1812858 RepID=UPI0038B9D629
MWATGLRISEFCGLTVKDLDFEHGKININKQLQRTRNMEYVIETTKTSSGTRQLPMTQK